LFVGSDRGGRTAAVFYAFTGTCKHHGIDPFAFLDDVLRNFPSHPAGRLDDLLSEVWYAAHPSARRKTSARIHSPWGLRLGPMAGSAREGGALIRPVAH
jgi:hypothetical protein